MSGTLISSAISLDRGRKMPYILSMDDQPKNPYAEYLLGEASENFIPLTKCEKGFLYKIHARNFSSGVFDGKVGFIGVRQKFGQMFLDTEDHYDAGAPYGTVKPFVKLCALPEGIPVEGDDVKLFNFLLSVKDWD